MRSQNCKSDWKLRHVCPSISVRPSAKNNSAPIGRIFMNIWHLRIFRKSIENIQFSLKWDKHRGYFTWRPIYIFIVSRSFLLRMRNVPHKVVKKIKTHHFAFNNFFKKRKCRLWENVVKYCRAGQATDDNMAHAHCMLDTYGYKNTHTQVV